MAKVLYTHMKDTDAKGQFDQCVGYYTLAS